MRITIPLLVLLISATITAAAEPQKKISVLLIDGMNNHDWQRGTRIMKSILESSNRFTVDVSTTPPTSQPADAWNSWRPKFDRYDVVVSNFNGGYNADKGAVHWPRE